MTLGVQHWSSTMMADPAAGDAPTGFSGYNMKVPGGTVLIPTGWHVRVVGAEPKRFQGVGCQITAKKVDEDHPNYTAGFVIKGFQGAPSDAATFHDYVDKIYAHAQQSGHASPRRNSDLGGYKDHQFSIESPGDWADGPHDSHLESLFLVDGQTPVLIYASFRCLSAGGPNNPTNCQKVFQTLQITAGNTARGSDAADAATRANAAAAAAKLTATLEEACQLIRKHGGDANLPARGDSNEKWLDLMHRLGDLTFFDTVHQQELGVLPWPFTMAEYRTARIKFMKVTGGIQNLEERNGMSVGGDSITVCLTEIQEDHFTSEELKALADQRGLVLSLIGQAQRSR